MSTPPDDTPGSRFNLSSWALRHRALVLYLMAMVALFGLLAYRQLAQSEDPPFTFKVMVVRTEWPGASARQVQEQLTDRIARKLQETPWLDDLRSYSRPGESLIFVVLKDSTPAAAVPDAWYQARKKVGDITAQLPQGVIGPFFNDEFGDVYTDIYVLDGDGYTPAQLRDYADRLRTALLRIDGVGKVDYFGDQAQHIYIDLRNDRLATLGLSPAQIAQAIAQRNATAAGGVVTTADDRIFVRPSGAFEGAEALAAMPLNIAGKIVRLGDIATVRRGYDDPPDPQMRRNGRPVLGIGVTMRPGGDVVRLGRALHQAMPALQAQLPAGLRLIEVSSMPRAVKHAVDDFLESVAEAVGIVLLVSLLSLGLRTGLVVVISIPFVLAATALGMNLFDIGLHKVSLGTLVLALGLLVDDAIIAIEMMAVKLEQGWDRMRAAAYAYTSTAFPMLTGTLVTVAGFLPIALARSSTGEYTRSIFEVSAIALLLSWLAAVIVIPLLGHMLLPERPRGGDAAHREDTVYDTAFYRRFAALLRWCLGHRALVLGSTLALFVLALAGFGLVPKQFFPSSDRPELLVDLRLPEDASMAATLRQVERLETGLRGLRGRDGIVDTVAYVGSGAPRFYLPLDEQLPQPNFAQLVVTARDVAQRERLVPQIEALLSRDFGGVRSRVSRLENGPPVGYPVQFRVSGDDIATVRGIAAQVAAVMRADPGTRNVQFDWDEPAARSLRFEVDQVQAGRLGVTSRDVADFLAMTLAGTTVTQLRQSDKLIAVDLRGARGDRIDPGQIERLSMPTPAGAVPLAQLGHVAYGLDYGVIWERDRQPTITVQADTGAGAQGVDVTQAIDARLGALRARLPAGYRIEVGGALEENAKAQDSIAAQMPLMVVVILTLLMIQLQSFSRTMMVVLTAPLGLIGVIGALLVLHQPFGFVAMLGTIAMFGIIMRNSVILVDQIEQDIRAGRSRFDAIVGATVRRLRPIALTAAAAVLALIPLLRSDFFGPMATALMGGITVATLLTLLYLPALYATWFRVHPGE